MEKFFKDKIGLLRVVKNLSKSPGTPEEIRIENETIKCLHCGTETSRNKMRETLYVCPVCGTHRNITAKLRLKYTCDENSFREFGRWIKGYNPLDFPGYEDKLCQAEEKTGISEAVITGTCRIKNIKAVICVMDARFLMASMGMAVGEKITRAIEYATKKRLPLIIFSASGGARMQEGMLSLMQMAKTSAAVAKLREAGGLFISVMTNPTTGGVTASFASLGDIQLAEPGALIGFAGPRVISQTIGEKLPEGFQSAEFLFEHGFLDKVVQRCEMRNTLANILLLHQKSRKSRIACEMPEAYEEFSDKFDAAERVMLARNEQRPTCRCYIDRLIADFCELGGDRCYGEDASIIGGVGRFRDIPVVVIGQQKGRSLEENLKYRFGMPNPEGYRKAERLMRHAEHFDMPIITFVDTPGAYPGKEAEENGQGSAIAHCLLTLSRVKVPIINIFIGEGGSGGALAIGFGDSVIMMENSVFSILSPEGFASILYKDSTKWKEACENMKMTAPELRRMGICDYVIEECSEGMHVESEPSFKKLEMTISYELGRLLKLNANELVSRRYSKLRRVGKELI